MLHHCKRIVLYSSSLGLVCRGYTTIPTTKYIRMSICCPGWYADEQGRCTKSKLMTAATPYRTICGFVLIFRNNRTCLRSLVRPMPDVLFSFTGKIHTRVPQGSLDRVCHWSLLLQFTHLICALLFFFNPFIFVYVCVHFVYFVVKTKYFVLIILIGVRALDMQFIRMNVISYRQNTYTITMTNKPNFIIIRITLHEGLPLHFIFYC